MTEAGKEYQHALYHLSRVFEKRMFFIVGLTRAGTVWLQNALDAHPDASCKGEGHFTDILFPMLAKTYSDYNQRLELGRKNLELAGIGDEFYGPGEGFSTKDVSFLMACTVALSFARTMPEDHIQCIGEKTPEQALGLDALTTALPQAQVIHVIRDGRDEAVSVYDYNVRAMGTAFTDKYPSLGDFVDYFAANWNRAVGAAHFFGRTHRENYIEIRSEDLHTEADMDIARVLRFLQLNDEDEAVSHCVEVGKQCAFPDGFVGHWKNRFDDETKQVFHRQAGELLKLLDYEV